MDQLDEHLIAKQMRAILERHKGQPHYRRLRVRLRDMGKNVRNEHKQFVQLQKACRESEELAAEFRDAEIGDIAGMFASPTNPEVGRLVNAFNRMVEQYWEDW